MSTVETWTLWTHVAAGTVAVAAGLVALATTKGGLRHRQAGKTFVASMAVTVGTVFVLLAFAPTRFRVFLALVAVFSGYLAFSGYRVLSRKRPADGPAPVDWIAAGAVVLACLGLGGWGGQWLLEGQTFGVVLVVFGLIGLGYGGMDLRTFVAGGGMEAWTVAHLQRMVAAYIATVSAVSAVNLTPLLPPGLGFVAWLWPTAVGAPVIAYYSNRYAPE